MFIYDDVEDGLVEIEYQKELGIGYVYIAEWGNIVKIGCTQNPYYRIKELSCVANYSNVKITRIALSKIHSNYKENEKMFHNHFKKYRIEKTELFNISFDDALNNLPSDILYKDELDEFINFPKIEYILQKIEQCNDIVDILYFAKEFEKFYPILFVKSDNKFCVDGKEFYKKISLSNYNTSNPMRWLRQKIDLNQFTENIDYQIKFSISIESARKIFSGGKEENFTDEEIMEKIYKQLNCNKNTFDEVCKHMSLKKLAGLGITYSYYFTSNAIKMIAMSLENIHGKYIRDYFITMSRLAMRDITK